MTFGNLNMLWLLLVIPPALLAFFWWAWRQRQALMTQFIQARLLPSLTVGLSTRRVQLRVALLTAAVSFLILALARPQWGFDWEEAKQRGLDIVVAIDTSKSMLAEDIAPNRLARAKLAALDLMQQARSDRLGLVAFAGSAFLQCPLTIDDSAFRQSVESLDVNTIPQGGTALADAIEAASTAFKESDNHRIMVLITDGEDHDSGALDAAKKAAETGLKIFTIGLGSKEGELLRVKDGKGRTDYIRDEQGNVVKSHLNEGLLQEIAGETKAVYYPLRGAKTMETLYRDWLAPLPKTDSEEKLIKRAHERYHWPLGLAIVLLVAEILLPERRRESSAKRSEARRADARTGSRTVAHAAATILFFALPFTGLSSPGSALREYKSGKYDQSLKEFQDLIQRKNDDPRLRFNAGTAAYRNRQFDEAAKQFDEAVTAPDLQLQEKAYYNRGNTFYHLGEAAPDPNGKTEIWKKAVQDFENSLRLDPQDADAKFNYEFVKKRIEELKQQQQQNQQNKSDQNQDQQQQQQQNQSKDDKKQDDKKQDQQQQQQQQQEQNKSDQKQDSAKQNQNQDAQQKEQEQKQQQAKQDQQKKDEKKQQQAKQAKQSKDKPEDDSQEQQAAAAAGQMTPEQAQQLLDAQMGDDHWMPSKPNPKPTDPNKPVKDW